MHCVWDTRRGTEHGFRGKESIGARPPGGAKQKFLFFERGHVERGKRKYGRSGEETTPEKRVRS